MKSAVELLDSRKVYASIEEFAANWVSKNFDEATIFQKVLDVIHGNVEREPKTIQLKDSGISIKHPAFTVAEAKTVIHEAQKHKGRPKGSKNKKAWVPAPLHDPDAPLTAAERKSIKEENAKNVPVDPQELINEAVGLVIKPNWASAPQDQAGNKSFNVKLNRERGSLSIDPDRWKEAFRKHGIPCSTMVAQVVGLSMNPDEMDKGTAMLRVMIG